MQADQRVVLDLTKTDNTYTEVDFIAAINVDMDASTSSKLNLHYHHENNTLPSAENDTTAFQTGAEAVALTPEKNVLDDPLDTFIDSSYKKHYDTRLVKIMQGKKLRYLGMNFSKQGTSAVQVGRIIGGPLWIPDRQPEVGMQWETHDTSLRGAATQGAYETYIKGRKARTLRAKFLYVDEAQAEEFDDIFGIIGQAKPIFVIADTGNPIRTSMYCTVTTPLARTIDFADMQSFGEITFSEIVPKTKG